MEGRDNPNMCMLAMPCSVDSGNGSCMACALFILAVPCSVPGSSGWCMAGRESSDLCMLTVPCFTYVGSGLSIPCSVYSANASSFMTGRENPNLFMCQCPALFTMAMDHGR